MTQNAPFADVIPYKGLIPYEEEDAQFFFGRDDDIDIIVANLIAYKLTVLYGPSGVGKSSIIRAGVVHKIQEREKKAARAVPKFIPIVFGTWHGEPVKDLKNSIIEALRPFISLKPSLQELPLDNFIRECTEKDKIQLLIILDQFEEYFLYNPVEKEDSFFNQLPLAINDSKLRANFLIALREDGLAKLNRFKGRIRILLDNYLRLEHLDEAAATKAIKEPIEQYNEFYSESFSIEDSLVSKIIEEVKSNRIATLEEEGKSSNDHNKKEIETPYLQLVMTRLWEEAYNPNRKFQLELDTFNNLGGFKGILRSHLNKVMEKFAPKYLGKFKSKWLNFILKWPNNFIETLPFIKSKRYTCAQLFYLFYCLATLSGGKTAYKLEDLERCLEKEGKVHKKKIKIVLSELSQGENRILQSRFEETGQEELYAVSYDVLAKPILNWLGEQRQFRKRVSSWLIAIGFGLFLLTLIFLSVVSVGLLKEQRLREIQSETITKEQTTRQLNEGKLIERENAVPHTNFQIRQQSL